MTPNKERIRLWVDELRSGKYKQTTGLLSRKTIFGDYFCCLGVACEVAMANGLEVDKTYRDGVWRYDNEGSLLPGSVGQWMGIFYRNPNVKAGGHYTNLSFLNDNGMGFPEIANLIEAEYLADSQATEAHPRTSAKP